jgi:FkbM family methyltransferase
MTVEPNVMALLFKALPSVSSLHSPRSAPYEFFKVSARKEIERLFENNASGKIEIFPFGEISFPYFNMGNIDSLNLFDLDELIIFSYYYNNKDCYKNVLDIGANIGLHTVVLGKCGYNVRAFEPDPVHFKMLSENIRLNGLKKIEKYNAAVSSKACEMEFVRVLGNTTGSHLAGSKINPYGELERLMVKVVPIKDHLKWADLIKLDAEGHEKEIIRATNAVDWEGKDAMIEISSRDNAEFIFHFFRGTKIKLFSQKLNWKAVKIIDDMPFTHHDGSLFLSSIRQKIW